jgi:hypothetical protein
LEDGIGNVERKMKKNRNKYAAPILEIYPIYEDCPRYNVCEKVSYIPNMCLPKVVMIIPVHEK